MNKKNIIKYAIIDFWEGVTERELDVFLSPLRERYDIVEDKTNPDLLIYSCFGDSHLNYQNCKRLFVCGENVVPDFNFCDYSVSTLKVQFENRNFWFPWGLFHNYPVSSITPLPIKNNPCDRLFCSFIYSQDLLGRGAKLRKKFCERLMKYRHVDCPGKVLHNLDSDELSDRHDVNSWHESKIRFLSKYKFNIAFENSDAHGYITEKLLDCYMANTVPIYWGSKGDISPFPRESMIYAQDYASVETLIDRIKEIDQDNDLYMHMLKANPFRTDKFFLSDFDNQLHNFMLRVVLGSKNTSHFAWCDFSRCIAYKKELEKKYFRLMRKIATGVNKLKARIFR